MRPFFARIGSKSTLVKHIIPMFPEHKTYVEPFLGSGAVFFKKEESQLEVLNDLDKSLYDDYMHLKSVKLENIPDSLDDYNKFYNEAENTPTNKLLKSILIRNNTFNCCGKGKIYDKGNPLNKLKLVDDYQNRLRKAIFHNTSYEEILRDYDSETTFFYLDPPYEGSKGLYSHYVFDYDKFRDILSSLKGKWLLSINDSERIRELFKEYKIVTVSTAKTAPPKNGKKIGRCGNKRNELLISNF